MKSKTRSKKETSNPKNLVSMIVHACDDAKVENLTVLDVSKVFSLADYFLVCSGRSDRQVLGIANRISQELEEKGHQPLAIEGTDQAHWVLMDYGDVVVHIFYEPERSRYNIEDLWLNAKKIEGRALVELAA
jgi:ribosome-associated protein